MKPLRSIAALVRLEVGMRWPVLATALLVGIASIPLAAVTRQQTVVFAVALAVAFCLGAAVLLGASMLAEPLAHGRVGFFLAQPLSTGALWWGRLLGAALVAIGAGLAALAPAWLWCAGRLQASEQEAVVLWGSSLLAALPVAAIGHALATFLRSRGSRVALDFGAVLGVAALIGWSARALGDAALDGRFAWVVPAALAPVLAIAAGHAQLWWGRGQVERGHLALSTTLWSPLLLAALLAVAVTGWALDLEPGDVESRELGPVAVADRSHWVALGGAVTETRSPLSSALRAGLYAQFLVDIETRDWVRLGPPLHLERRRRHPAADPTLARDGSRVAWRNRDGEVFFADLPAAGGRGESRGAGRELSLAPQALPPDFADSYVWSLSPDGRYLAAVLVLPQRGPVRPQGFDHYLGSLHVVVLPSGLPVYSGALPWQLDRPANEGGTTLVPWSVNLRWLDGTRLDLAGCLGPPTRPDPESPGGQVHAAFAQLDLTSAQSSGPAFDPAQTRAFADPACARYKISYDGLLSGTGTAWWASDWALRATSGTPPVHLDAPHRRTHGLAIGDTWVAQLSASRQPGWLYQSDVRLHWLDREGKPLGEIPIGELAAASLSGEVAPGRLLVLVTEPGVRDARSPTARQRILLFDPAEGKLEPVEHPAMPNGVTLRPLLDESFVRFPSRPTWAPEPGSLSTQLYFTNEGSLVHLDVEEGVLRLVQAAPGSRNLFAGR